MRKSRKKKSRQRNKSKPWLDLSDLRCADDCRLEHQGGADTFRCAFCGKLRCVSYGCSDDFPDFCDGCWVEIVDVQLVDDSL